MTDDEQPIETVSATYVETSAEIEDQTAFIAWQLQNETIRTFGNMYAVLHSRGIDTDSPIMKAIEGVFISVAEDWRPRNAGTLASIAALTVEETADNADDENQAGS